MLDVKRLRTDLDAVKRGLARKGADLGDVAEAAALDRRHREQVDQRDRLRAQVNQLSKEVGRLRAAGEQEQAVGAMTESRALGAELAHLTAEADSTARALRDLLLRIPNVPAEEAPDGADESENVVVRTVGFDPERYGPPQRVPHWEIGPALGLLDLERGAKISGAMFPVYRGAGARLLRALTSFALDRHTDFEEIRPPHLVKSDTLTATGQLPKFADDAYHVERDDLWAIPTSEVPLTSLARDEILAEADLPVRLTAATPCYRREAGSAGRDTRGLLRSHEFDKVEILAYTTPDQAPAMHEELLGRAEALLQALELPYRVLEICTGDLGQPHARQFDLEVYAPGVDAWLEVSSVSWYTDYQARRANIRYRRAVDGRIEHIHTLNGSALAWSRIWPTLVETGHQADGSVTLPEALHPWFPDGVLARP